MKYSMILCVTTLIAAACLAQSQFAVSAGGEYREEIQSIINTSDGGYASTGHTWSYGAGYTELFIAKHTSSGHIEWATTVGADYQDNGNDILQTTDGGYAVAGVTWNFHLGYSGFFLVKFSSTGAMQWAKKLASSYNEYCYSIVQTSDGGFVIAGQTVSYAFLGYNIFVVKFTSTGDFAWARVYGSSGDDCASSMIKTSDGGYLILGYTLSFGAGENDLLVVKLDSSFDIQWAKTIGGTGDEYSSSAVQTADGGYAILGHSESWGAGGFDLMLVKLSSSGVVEWATSAGGASNEYSASVIQTADGKYIAVGNTESFGADIEDALVVKFTSAGSVEWAKTIGGTTYDGANSVIRMPDGGFTVAGFYGHWSTSDDLLIAKFDNADNNCLAVDAAVISSDITDLVLVADQTLGDTTVVVSVVDVSPTVTNPTIPDTILCGGLGVEEASLPEAFAISAHPNPFNSAVKIAVEGVGDGSPVPFEVEIYDVNGRMVEGGTVGAYCIRPFDGSTRLTPTTQEYIWSPDKSLPSGVYLVRARFDSRSLSGVETTATAAKRVVYLK